MRAVVAATKLTIPGSRQPLVPRPELGARLDGDHRMALVSAPAGYGKTATLSSWAHERAPSVAWLSCDPSDAEPTRFMAGLLAAISTRWPGAADDALVLLDRDGNDLYDAAVAVANELADVDGAGVIVVDDLHLATPSRAVLAAFIDALPANVMFVAGTRSDPPLSLARLRLHGDLLELRTADLRFTPAETARFFELRGVTMATDELLRLHHLTEGWPAGVQLAAIALRARRRLRLVHGRPRQHRSGGGRLPRERGARPAAAGARGVPPRDVRPRHVRCRAVRSGHGQRGLPRSSSSACSPTASSSSRSTTGRTATATTTCSARSCGLASPRRAARSSAPRTNGRAGRSRTGVTRQAPCSTAWPWATSSGPGTSCGRPSAASSACRTAPTRRSPRCASGCTSSARRSSTATRPGSSSS